MEQWAADLKLTDAQRAQIAGIFATLRGEHGGDPHRGSDHRGDFNSMHDGVAHGPHFADSFRSETLTLPPPQDAHVHAGAMADHFVRIAEAALPILTPEQRTLAAAKLRQQATAGAANEDAPLSE